MNESVQDVRGKVALIERGGCPFVDKVKTAAVSQHHYYHYYQSRW